MSEKTDAELVEMVRRVGDTNAYGILVKRYQGHAYGLAYSILGDWAEALDIAQEAFLRAYVNLHTLDKPERFPAWLRRIVFSTCITWLRTFRPEFYRSIGEPDNIDQLDDIPDSTNDSPMDYTLKNEMSEVVLSAISDLPQKYRIPLTMFHLDGLSYKKVAEFLEIPLGTVKSLISRARKRLKPALESYAQEVLPMVKEVLDEHKLTEEFAERVIEGIKGWLVQDKKSSVHASHEAITNAIGGNVSYDYLVGVSGLAFRMQVSTGVLCPSSPHPNCGYLCIERSVRALPWKGRFYKINPDAYKINPDEAADEEAVRKVVAESIDRGVPVIYSGEEDGIVIGYKNKAKEWICLHPWDKGRGGGTKPFIEKGLPWAIYTFHEQKDTLPSRKELAIEALKQAVDMAKTTDVDAYLLGFNAWQGYIEKLNDLMQADDKTREESMFGNSWIYECLASYRGIATQYLRDISAEFDLKVSEHLLMAADLYEQMSYNVLRDDKLGVLSIAPLSWSNGKPQRWTTEMIQKQINRLEEALPLERQAIGEIEKALNLLS